MTEGENYGEQIFDKRFKKLYHTFSDVIDFNYQCNAGSAGYLSQSAKKHL